MIDRLKAWVQNVSANPLNDDQLLLANDVVALLDQLEEAHKVIDFYWSNSSTRALPSPQLKEAYSKKARNWLAKYGEKK